MDNVTLDMRNYYELAKLHDLFDYPVEMVFIYADKAIQYLNDKIFPGMTIDGKQVKEALDLIPGIDDPDDPYTVLSKYLSLRFALDNRGVPVNGFLHGITHENVREYIETTEHLSLKLCAFGDEALQNELLSRKFSSEILLKYCENRLDTMNTDHADEQTHEKLMEALKNNENAQRELNKPIDYL
jgi:hypothetical protein